MVPPNLLFRSSCKEMGCKYYLECSRDYFNVNPNCFKKPDFIYDDAYLRFRELLISPKQ